MTNILMHSPITEQLNLDSKNSLQFDYSRSHTSKFVSEIKNDSYLIKQAKIKEDIQKRIKKYMKL